MSKSTPPQMPEVIYIYTDEGTTRFVSNTKTTENEVSYTRTDLCEELKAALKGCVDALNEAQSFDDWTKASNALTKAQGLL